MREMRNLPITGLEVRRDGEGKPTGIAGYALRFFDPSDSGTEFRIMENVIERIMPGSVVFADDVTATFNHDSSQLLGRQSSGTARFSIDNRGVRFDIDLPETTVGRDVGTLVDRRDVRGSSFAFQVNGESGEDVRKENGVFIRELRSLTFFEGGPVTNPAYDATSVDLRSVEALKASEVQIDEEDVRREERLREMLLTDVARGFKIPASKLSETV